MTQRLSRLDGLRALAILGVIAVHTGIAFPARLPLLGMGQYGVELFFLISGYVLCYVASKGFEPKEFFLKRFFRLAPLYYLVLALCYVVRFNETVESLHGPVALDLKNLLIHLTFLHGLHPDYLRSTYSVMWSLTPEIVFYAVFPLLFRRSTRFLVAAFVVCLVVARLTARFSVLLWGSGAAVDVWAGHSPLNTMYLFLFGMLVYRHPEFFRRPAWTVAAGLSGALFLLDGLGLPITPVNLVFTQIFSNAYFGYVMLLFPWLVSSENRLVIAVLDSRPATFLGRISYSAFFVHYAVVQIFARFLHGKLPYPLGLALVLAVTALLSWLSFRFIEQPGIRLGREVARALERIGWMPAPARQKAGA